MGLISGQQKRRFWFRPAAANPIELAVVSRADGERSVIQNRQRPNVFVARIEKDFRAVHRR